MVYFAIIEAQFNNNNYNYYNPVDGILEIDRGGIMNVIAKKLKGGKTLVYLLAGVFALWAEAAWAADWKDASDNEYTALKYIRGTATGSNTGGGWIVTEIQPVSNDVVKMRFKLTETRTQSLWCSRGTRTTTATFTGFYINSKIRCDRHGDTSASGQTSPSTSGDDCVVVADYGTCEFWVNGTTQDATMASGTYTPGSTLMLFASHTKGSSLSAGITASEVSNRGSYYLYYFQLCSSTGELKHNLMPAKNMKSNVVGLYDTVTSNFYAKATNSGDFIAAEWGSDRAGKKWTGLGGDNKMSTAANWANNDKPEAGDDIDFTIAVPNATIDADIDATFGKVYLGTGDIPKFTGVLSATAINDLERMTDYAEKTKADFSFTLAAPSGQNFTWNGSAANWWAADAWDYNTAASVWYDNNTAVFNTANATATLNANVTAAGVVFSADATIGGAATLTVPTVSVAQNVSATIAAPTSGALAKTGAGTLTLESSRADATILNEGMLALSGAASLDWSQFTFGTDSAKPVTLEVGPTATIANIPNPWKVQSINGVNTVFCKQGGNWSLGSGALYLGGTSDATASFQHNGGTLTVGGYLSVGEGGTGLLDICGGTVESTYSGTYTLIGNWYAGTVVVTNGGSLVVSASVAVGNNAGSSGTLVVADGGTVSVGGSLIFCNRNALTSGRIDLRRGGVIAAVNAYRMNAGSATFNFDGGTFVKSSGTGNVFPVNGAVTAIDVTMSANGGTIDNNGLAITIPCTITGVGGLTLSGAGTTTVSADQSYTGTTTVSNGTTLSVGGGVTFAGPVVFAAGSVLDIAEYVGGVTPLSATSLTFPESGNVPLTFNGGAFITGAYAICPTSLVSVAQAEAKFAPSTGGLDCSWDVSATGDLLLLVGDIHGYSWTGLAGDNKFANGGNWVSGIAPSASGSVDFSAVSSNISINMEDVPEGTTFGEVTMGTGVITFTGEFAATSFSDTSKIAVGADSTVTVLGDLEFGAAGRSYICYSVAQGGKFEVTGDIIATPDKTLSLLPCEVTENEGVISAKGLVSRNSNDVFALSWFENNAFAKWLIGENGICGTGTGAFFVGDKPGGQATIIAATNFVVSAHIISWRDLTFDTAGFTVTLGTNTLAKSGGISGNGNKNTEASGSVTVRGAGKVVVNYNVNDLTTSSISQNNPFTVTDGATLVFKPGANIGTGLLTIESGAALEIPESGMVTHNGDLSLETGAALAFNFTDRKTAPVLALAEGKTVAFTGEGEIAVKIKITGDVWPIGGDYVLTACGGFDAEGVSLADGAPKWAKGIGVNEEGNIVLTVRPKPTMIIVR